MLLYDWTGCLLLADCGIRGHLSRCRNDTSSLHTKAHGSNIWFRTGCEERSAHKTFKSIPTNTLSISCTCLHINEPSHLHHRVPAAHHEAFFGCHNNTHENSCNGKLERQVILSRKSFTQGIQAERGHLQPTANSNIPSSHWIADKVHSHPASRT